MAIDGCRYTFPQLARRHLPARMRQMRQAMRWPLRMSEFGERGVGPKTVLRSLGRKEDFPGCYVFLYRRRPYYVGISRSVIQRLLQHVKGTTHFDASLAYRMASYEVDHKSTRSSAMKERQFLSAFQKAKTRIRASKVAFIEIGDDVELHLFEAYCAMALDTSPLNSFKTH